MSNMYTFSETQSNGVSTSVNFVVPYDGVTGSTFHSMCISAMRAFGWGEETIEKYMGEADDDAFMEFYDQDDEQ